MHVQWKTYDNDETFNIEIFKAKVLFCEILAPNLGLLTTGEVRINCYINFLLLVVFEIIQDMRKN